MSSTNEMISGKEPGGGSGGEGQADMHRLLSQSIRASYDYFKRDPQWSYSELLNVINFMWLEEPQKELGREMALKHYNALELNEPSFRAAILKLSDLQVSKRVMCMSELTQMGFMEPYDVQMKGALDYRYVSDEFFLRPFMGSEGKASSGNFVTIHGVPGSGKTDLAGLLIEKSVIRQPNEKSPGMRATANIKTDIATRPPGLTLCRTLKSTLITCINNLFAGYVTNIFNDETKLSFNRKRASSNNYVNQENIMTILRKVGGNWISIIQNQEDTPTILQRFSQTSFHKESKTKLVMKHEGAPITVYNVPRTKLKFDTSDPASFVIDVNVDGAFQYLSALPEGTNQIAALRDFLEQSANAPTDIEVTLAAKVLYYRLGNQKDVGDILGLSPSAISKRLSSLGIQAPDD
jgi:hypothetical protein